MRRIAGSALLLLFLSSCTSHYQVRGTESDAEPIPLNSFHGLSREKRAVQIATEHRSIERFEDFTMGVLEIADDGSVNHQQKEQVTAMVRSAMKEKGGLVVVFVHGWHHGARTCD